MWNIIVQCTLKMHAPLTRNVKLHERDPRAVMHVWIANPQWWWKGSQLSRRNVTYLARGPWPVDSGSSWKKLVSHITTTVWITKYFHFMFRHAMMMTYGPGYLLKKIHFETQANWTYQWLFMTPCQILNFYLLNGFNETIICIGLCNAKPIWRR